MEIKNIITFTSSNLPTMSTEEITNIYNTHFNEVYLRIHALVANDDVAGDLAADVFISLYESKEPIVGDTNIRSFLSTTSVELSFNYLKRAS